MVEWKDIIISNTGYEELIPNGMTTKAMFPSGTTLNIVFENKAKNPVRFIQRTTPGSGYTDTIIVLTTNQTYQPQGTYIFYNLTGGDSNNGNENNENSTTNWVTENWQFMVLGFVVATAAVIVGIYIARKEQ